MKPTDEQLMANAGIPPDTAPWVAELVLALNHPDDFTEVIQDETLVQSGELADTYARFEAALRSSRAGVQLVGPEYRASLEAALARFCKQCLEEGVRRGVSLVGWNEREVSRLSGSNSN